MSSFLGSIIFILIVFYLERLSLCMPCQGNYRAGLFETLTFSTFRNQFWRSLSYCFVHAPRSHLPLKVCAILRVISLTFSDLCWHLSHLSLFY